jgi:uncharacterized protein
LASISIDAAIAAILPDRRRLVKPGSACRVLLLKLLFLPLVAIRVPLLRIAPMIAAWRKNRWLKLYYARLRDVEDRLATARWPSELRDAINELEALRGEVQAVSRELPPQQQQDVYHWRLHLSLILNEATERLGKMESAAAL